MTGITLKSIKKVYCASGNEAVQALRGIDATFEPNRCVAVMGPSGSGKSTLLHLLAGLLPPTDGEYRMDGINVYGQTNAEIARMRNQAIGLVSQDFALLEDMSALENVAMPMMFSKTVAWNDLWNRAKDMLVKVGMNEATSRPVANLSGGQRQRVAIARACVLTPRLLLCDEPTASLDGERANGIMDLLQSFRNDNTIVIIATHDTRVADRCNYTIKLRDGYIDEMEKGG